MEEGCSLPQTSHGSSKSLRSAQFILECISLFDYVASTWGYLLVYLIIGGSVICWLERDADLQWKEAQFLKTQVLNLTEDQWAALQAQGLYERPSFEALETQWTLPNSMFLLLTSITTIGYGRLTPRTASGMMFTLVYTMLGLGFVATTTVRTAERCIKCIRLLIDDHAQLAQRELEAKAALHFRNVASEGQGVITRTQLVTFLQTLSYGSPPSVELVDTVFAAAANEDGYITETTFPMAVATYYAEVKGDPASQQKVLSIAVALFVSIWLGGAAIFQFLEGWTYVEAVWFGFVTITTIGFGDYAPETVAGQLFAYLYIIVGLGMGALVVSATADVVESRQRRLDSSVRRILGPRLDPMTRRIRSFGWTLVPQQMREIMKESKLA